MTAEKAPGAALAAALVAAQRAARAVGKVAKNAHHGYRYASSEAIIEEAREALSASGLAFVRVSSEVTWEEAVTVESAKGKRTQRTGSVVAHYSLIHGESGESLACSAVTPCVAESGRPEDKAVAAALTYSLGYMLRDLLLLPRVEEEQVDQRDDRDRSTRAAKPLAFPTHAAKNVNVQIPDLAAKTVASLGTAVDESEVDAIVSAAREIAADDEWGASTMAEVKRAKDAALARVRGAVAT